MFNKYSSLLINASRNIYSVPKYNANEVNTKTNAEATRAKLSIQNKRWESIRSRQENHRPKSM